MPTSRCLQVAAYCAASLATENKNYSFSRQENATDGTYEVCYGDAVINSPDQLIMWLHTGVELMNKLVEIRRQEHFCRERSLRDSERKSFWLAEAEIWEQRALDEIAFHFRECNLEVESPSIHAA